MPAISLRHRLFPTTIGALLVSVLACGDDFTLPDPSFINVVDTVVLAALSGTPISAPSGFDVVVGEAVRTDRTNAFDFAFDLDAGDTPRLHPAGTLGLAPDAGILRSEESFAGITSAPLEGYVTDSTLVAPPGTVFVVRSRNSNVQCSLSGGLPRYGKFHVLSVDLQTRAITLEMLVDLNCGYRGLEPGTPES
jgi:hypothetical protein